MPTTIGFVSDIHGDFHALRDALRLLDAMCVRQILCLGDVVDYGVFPDESLALLAERAIPTLRGNHDRWCLGNKSMGTNATDLEIASRRFLKTTVPSWSATIEGVRVAAHHARPENDMHGVMPDATPAELDEVLRAANADVVVVGHTHRAMEPLAAGRARPRARSRRATGGAGAVGPRVADAARADSRFPQP